MSTQGVIKISGKPINAKQLIVSYSMLPESDADEMGYFISIWEGKQPGAEEQALKTLKIKTGLQVGRVSFEELSLDKKDYVVGFSISGAAGRCICATLNFSANVDAELAITTSLSNVFVPADRIGTNFLIANFITPLSLNKSSNWIALFPGAFKSDFYDGANVLGFAKAAVNQNSGVIIMKDIPKHLSRFGTYTVVLGMGLDKFGNPDYKTLMSSHTFIVWKSSFYVASSAFRNTPVMGLFPSFFQPNLN